MQHILWDSQSAAQLLEADEPEDVKDLLDRIVASSRWMQRRTEGLQAASGLTGGRSYNRERVSAEKAFDESHRMLAAVDQFVRNASVTRDELPRVVSNEVLLGFLFQNLLQNACKYGRVDVPVEVHVSAKRAHDGWQFCIKDNGRGVPEDRINSIFEPYIRGGNVGADEPGSGIGLSFCHAIVEWHRGQIWVETGSMPGSKFIFTIPDLKVGR
jgi:signal transduction histidine kinase